MVITCHKNPADEIGIFMLYKIYNRHCIIYHNEGFWMTVKHKDSASSNEGGNLCDIHLLHTSGWKYCEFKELKGKGTSGINKQDAKQLLSWFAKKRQLKAQFVPRETRGSEKRKLLSVTTSVTTTPPKLNRGMRTSNRPTRDASKGVNYFELNEGLPPPRPKKAMVNNRNLTSCLPRENPWKIDWQLTKYKNNERTKTK